MLDVVLAGPEKGTEEKRSETELFSAVEATLQDYMEKGFKQIPTFDVSDLPRELRIYGIMEHAN